MMACNAPRSSRSGHIRRVHNYSDLWELFPYVLWLVNIYSDPSLGSIVFRNIFTSFHQFWHWVWRRGISWLRRAVGLKTNSSWLSGGRSHQPKLLWPFQSSFDKLGFSIRHSFTLRSLLCRDRNSVLDNCLHAPCAQMWQNCCNDIFYCLLYHRSNLWSKYRFVFIR